LVKSVKVPNRRQEQEQDRLAERTEVIQGPENILNFILPRYAYIKKCIDACFDYSGPSHVTTTEPIWQELLKLEKRGVKIRFLTDIRKENIIYCNKFLTLKNSEIRHLDSVKGNYGIADRRECFEHAVNKEGELPTHAIFTTVKGIVDTRQFLFDDLWKRATPAKLRIKEVEEGMIPDMIETIKESSEIINLAYKLVKSANSEILIIFHTANALLRHKKSGGIDLLIENVIKNNTQTRILVPIEDKVKEVIHKLEQVNGIDIRNIEAPMQTRMTILLVDKKYSLVVELKNDTKFNFDDAIGLATYSNSKSTVLSYVSIFETLWKQSELREELLTRSLAQKEFINIAAHELRNPIQPILGLSEILLKADDTIFNGSSRNNTLIKKEMVEIIVRNARRLQRLTEDILDVTRIEGRSLNLNKQSFFIVRIIREMIKDYSSEIRNFNGNLSFSFFSPEELDSIHILADENRIKQVIANLVDNAIKFTEEGMISVSVEISPKHDYLIVKVEDTGSGIDKEILPRLFTKFVTKSVSGTGLGLYICKGIIEAHNGNIWAKNNSVENKETGNSKGATFGFSLPLSHSTEGLLFKVETI
jgi:signal transduction histidine kinase